MIDMGEIMTFLENKVIWEDLEEIYKRDIGWEKLRGKTILITGAYGMLASYVTFLCIYLNEVHHFGLRIIAAVRNIDKLSARFGEYVDKAYFEICLDDINKPLSVQGEIHYIVHGASLASSQFYGSMPIDVILPNVLGTMELLKLAQKRKNQSFLLFSSGEIYGQVDSGIEKITEQSMGAVDPLNLRNCYSEAKRMAEMLCKAWYVQQGVSVKIARICHTYGPTMDLRNDTRVFASFVNDIVNNRNIVMKSNGLAKRPFCYIADAVAGYFMILLNGAPGEAYNVCNSKEFISIRELADTLVSLYPDQHLNVEMQICQKGSSYMEATVEKDIVVSNDKLVALRWECQYSVREGFRRTIEGIIPERKIRKE